MRRVRTWDFTVFYIEVTGNQDDFFAVFCRALKINATRDLNGTEVYFIFLDLGSNPGLNLKGLGMKVMDNTNKSGHQSELKPIDPSHQNFYGPLLAFLV